MAKDFSEMEDSNTSTNPSIHDLLPMQRRQILRWGAASGMGVMLMPMLAACAAGPSAQSGTQPKGPLLGFKSVPVDRADRLVVPEGYIASVIAAWGEPIGVPGQMPAFKPDGSNTAAEQAVQMGMHHDGMHYYPLDGSKRGLLAMNHEYTDEGLLHTDGQKTWSAEKVAKSMAAHGLSVIEVQNTDKGWEVVRPSRYARRFPMTAPFTIGGPGKGHAMMKTSADPNAQVVLGTLNNCASGQTPWGTYLSGEENWAGYFDCPNPDAHEKRWGLRNGGSGYRWHEHVERFDTAKEKNEPNRFGWIVEMDPTDPTSTPVKRTALGRAAHEGAWVAVTKDNHAVVYSGEDARGEYIYKFVSRDAIKPGGAKANATLLDHGTLYVAQFGADGKGRWLPMVHGQGPLTVANGFADQGEVCIKARQASDLLGATKMDRPEWLAIDPNNGWVYCTLTNNTQRGVNKATPVDAANPRANNTMGHIIRWKEVGDFEAPTFDWNHLVLAGDPANERAEAKGNIKGDIYACPDGLAFDPNGTLWIQTDMSSSAMGKGDVASSGNNQMLACDPATGQTRRFLTGPVNCEITGATWTPDMTTLFINVQHPGETPSESTNPTEPRKYSNWPDFLPNGRPRSATVVIRKRDGGVIGT